MVTQAARTAGPGTDRRSAPLLIHDELRTTYVLDTDVVIEDRGTRRTTAPSGDCPPVPATARPALVLGARVYADGTSVRICPSLGGRRETVYGLAGLGDLLTTGWSQHSRNRTLGEKLGADADWQRYLREKTVEGVIACRAIKELTHDLAMALPLLETVHGILFADLPGPDAMRTFLRTFSYG